MKFIFIRHALTQANIDGIYSKNDTEISNLGFTTLQKTSLFLKDYDYHQVYTSNLLRTKQTAMKLGIKKFKEDTRLREMDFGDLKGKNISKTREIYNELFKNYRKNPINTKFPNGESRLDVYNRAKSFLEEKQVYNKDILIISHGIFIATALCWVLDDFSLLDKFKIDNGSISIIKVKRNEKILECVNKI